MSDELFKAKWQYSKDEDKKKGRNAHLAASAVTGGTAAVGGWKMGRTVGDQYARGRALGADRKASLVDAIRVGSKTSNFRRGAALTGTAVVGGGVADHVARKKKVLVKKSDEAETSEPPFGVDHGYEVSKSVANGLKQIGHYAGSVPRNTMKSSLGQKLAAGRKTKSFSVKPKSRVTGYTEGTR